jgi:transposase-like protein
MTKTGYLKRHRYPESVIKFAVFLHMLIPSRYAALAVFLFFRARVTHKTVCAWTQKFNNNFSLPLPTYSPEQILICHADEKYVKVNGDWHYWWSIKDNFGNIIYKIVTKYRDFASAKKLFIEARKKIGRDVDILIRDGLSGYDRATKFLGRKCKSIVAGINGKGFIFKKNFYWITNNPAESLNSEIDSYLAKFQNNFSSLESANRFADIFMLRKHLKKSFMEKKLSETPFSLNLPCI